MTDGHGNDESSPFQAFCETAVNVGSTTKRLEKAAFVGAYLSALNDSDFVYAARFLSGHLFPLRDERTVNIGGATLINALVHAAQADEIHARTRLVALGDAGDLAGELFAENKHTASRTPVLTLSDIATFLATLAQTSGSKAKLSYVQEVLNFCTPIEATFWVKLLQGDLRIGLKEGQVEDALARMAGVTVGEVQRANMLLGDIGETALLVRYGRLSEAGLRLFSPVKFMLATAADNNEEVAKTFGGPFVVEDKYDGIRAQVHVGEHDGAVQVRLFSRTLDEVTGAFPELVAPFAHFATGEHSSGLILDGEIVPVSPQTGAVQPFQSLQPRLGRKNPTEAVQQSAPVALIAYDILMAGGQSVLDVPLRERRTFLETLPFDGNTTRLAPSRVFGSIDELDHEFTQARSRGNEGLMAKDPRSLYKPGRRGKEWLKIKRALATLDVVITAAQVGEGRRSRFLSDFTFAVRQSETDPTLLNVGKAYSGLTDEETQRLSDWCKAHTLEEFAHGRVRTVEPHIVLEVTFDRVQASARHKSGYALRFPRILRIRDDKPPTEIDTLEAVRRLAAEEGNREQGIGGEE
jgi:DNA ligase-1